MPTLYGRGPDERVFSTYNEDEAQDPHLHRQRRRGPAAADRGRRERDLPGGRGAAVPPPASLPRCSPRRRTCGGAQPRAAGPAAPTPSRPAEIRAYAPRSVLTFGRGDLGQRLRDGGRAAPGVSRAAAVVGAGIRLSSGRRCRVFVGDDAARSGVGARPRCRRRPTRTGPDVLPAVRLLAALRLVCGSIRRTSPSGVRPACARPLLGGLFAPGALGLGEPLYRSRDRGGRSPAVRGVRPAPPALSADSQRGRMSTPPRRRVLARRGGFFTMRPRAPAVSTEVEHGERRRRSRDGYEAAASTSSGRCCRRSTAAEDSQILDGTARCAS